MNHTAAAAIPPSPVLAPTPAPRKKHRNLAQGVVESFTQTIQAGTLKPGEKLPTESVIMEMHGVSRTVVREAISHLQAAGLVQTRHGIGTFVLAPQPANLRISSDTCLLYTSPSPRDRTRSRMPSSA